MIGQFHHRKCFSLTGLLCGIVLLCCIVVSVVIALYTKSTFFDGNALIADIDNVPYYLNYRLDTRFFDPEIQDPSIDSVRAMESKADVIALIQSTGKREAGQYGLITTVSVQVVYKGSIQKDTEIKVLEPVRLEPVPDEQQANIQQLASNNHITMPHYQAFMDSNYVNGLTLMNPSRRYLIFLREIEPSTINGVVQGEKLYSVLNSPYTRISLGSDAGICIASEQNSRYVLVGSLHNDNIIVADKDSADAYRMHSADILIRFLGSLGGR